MKKWLADIHVVLSESVCAKLIEEKVDVDAVKGLDDTQLKELGFLMGDRSKILQATKGSLTLTLTF